MAGRQTEYKKEYNTLCYRACLFGCNFFGIAFLLDIDIETLLDWCQQHEEFSLALKKGIEDYPSHQQKVHFEKQKRREYKRSKHIREYNNQYAKNAHNTDPRKRVRNNFSCLLRSRLKSKNKQHVFDILSYSINDLMIHLEGKFKDGMTWENYGQFWQIDHIKPDCLFNYTSQHDDDFIACWSLSNLQPLLALDNMRKGGRYAGQ